MQPEMFSISWLSTNLGRDRRTLNKKLADLPPAEVTETARGTNRRYWLRDVVAHLYEQGAPEAGDLDANQERARKDKEMADKLAMENALTRGDVARLSVIETELAGVLSDHRANALALPSKVAPLLEGLTVHQRRERLEEAIYELLMDLANHKFGQDETDETPEACKS